MDCPKCGGSNPERQKHCGACGQQLLNVCAACGAAAPLPQKFCGDCGQPLDTTQVPAQAAGGTATTPSRAAGERRQATVLFSDLSGFTAMSEKLDPEEVEGLMRRLKARAVGIVEAHGGIVNQFVGDEVLALFGIPVAHEDDPLRAVRAAAEIHALARELSPEVEDKIGRPLAMHTGINTGLIVTSTADDRDGRIGVTGDTVNTGARLKALAGDDAILLSPETARLVDAYVRVESLDPAELKGKAAPVTPYRVVGEVAAGTSRFEAATARHGLTALAGRERELATLQRALERAVGGEGQLVTVIGEAGVGKSRLLHEFRQRIDRDAVTVLEGRCQSYGAETPYLPLLDALRRGLRIQDLTDSAALHDTAVTNIRAISPDLEQYLPHLLHLLSIPSEAHTLPETLQGEALRRELEAALAATITLNTAHRPMVVIYEDWHWADEASDAALNNLIGLVGHYPLLLVVLYRPEYQRKWADLESYTGLVLHSLDVAQSGQMLASVLGVDDLPAGLAQTVHGRTGGNALFNEEIAHALRDEGMVEIAEGAAKLTRPLEELTLPDTVHAVIRARVDRLEPADREILRLASVIGREFGRAVLERIAPSAELADHALGRLARQDLVHQVRVLPQAEYRFKHVLTQEVVYETLLLSQRKELHARVGAAIEAVYADRLEEHYEDLARHYRESENAAKAIDYFEKAGDKAMNYHSRVEARTYYREAIGVLQTRKDFEEHKRRFIEFALKWAEASPYASSTDHFNVLDAARKYAEAIRDESLVARITYWIGQLHYWISNPRQAAADLQSCIARAKKLADRDLEILADNALGRCYWMMADHLVAIEHLNRAIPMLEEQGPPEEISYSLHMLAFSEGFAGQFHAGLLHAERSRIFAVQSGSLTRQAAHLGAVYFNHFYRGTWSEFRSVANQCLDAGERLEIVILQSLPLCCLGYVEFAIHRQPAGIARIREGIHRIEPTGNRFALSFMYGCLGECLALAADPAGADQTCETSLAFTKSGEALGESTAYRALAIAAASDAESDAGRVDQYMLRSLSLSDQRGERPIGAITRFRYAECLHKHGDLEAAREQLDRAGALFREMGMDWWTEQAEGLWKRIDSGAEFVWFAPYIDGPPAVE